MQGYHILAMALFTPALLVEPQLLSISLAIAAALLMAVEVLRVGGVPFIGPRIHGFMTAFIDSRDSGVLLVSHFSLLAGLCPLESREQPCGVVVIPQSYLRDYPSMHLIACAQSAQFT